MHNPTAPAAPTRPRLPGDREMVMMMAMVMALNALAIASMLPTLPAIGEALGVTVANDRPSLIPLFLPAVGFAPLPSGPLAARFGRRAVLLPVGWVAGGVGKGC